MVVLTPADGSRRASEGWHMEAQIRAQKRLTNFYGTLRGGIMRPHCTLSASTVVVLTSRNIQPWCSPSDGDLSWSI
jgi:hypothetical protein